MHENSAVHPGGASTICYTRALFNSWLIVMLNPKFFEEMSSKLSEAVANSPAKDFEKNARALLAQGFAKLDLVTREEYEVLAQRLERLETRIAALEAQR
jgi:ubiquinone biosynthesis accessory factor UbiK